MTEKMTKRDWFETVKRIVIESGSDMTDGAVAFIDRELELLERRSSKSTLTKTQKENIAVMALIKDALFEVAKPVTVTELMASSAEVRAYSSQKISALLKQMKDKGEVIRTEVKKTAYFSLPSEK